MKISKVFTFTFLLAILLVSFSSTASKSKDAKVGAIGYFNAFCLNKKDAENLSEVVAIEGDKGYRRVMNDKNIKCFKAKPLQVMLLEKVWTVEHLSGLLFQFWLVQNQAGVKAYTWTLIKGINS